MTLDELVMLLGLYMTRYCGYDGTRLLMDEDDRQVAWAVERFNEVLRENICGGVTGPCGAAGTLRRQRTSYVQDARNWDVLCDACQVEMDKQWEEKWAEYYAGCL